MSDLSADAQDYLAELSGRPGARSPATLGEIWSAEWQRTGLDTIGGVGKPFEDAYAKLSSAVETAHGEDLGTAAAKYGVNFGAAVTPDMRIAALNQLADVLPEDKRKALEPLRDVRKRAAEDAQAIEKNASDVEGSTYGLAGVGTAWLAGLARQTLDPVNLAAMAVTAPIGGPLEGSVLRVIGRQAAAGGIAQAMVEPQIESARADLGLDSGFGRAVGNVAQAAIGSGALAGLFRGAAAVVRRVRGAPAAADESILPPRAETPSAPEFPTGESRIEPAGPSAATRLPDVVAPEDLEAAATHAETQHVIAAERPADADPVAHDAAMSQVTEAAEAPRTDPPVSAAEDLPPPPPPKRRFGVHAIPEESLSLFQLLAKRGGIRDDDPLIADLMGILGENPFIPGFGKLIRKPQELSTAARRSGRSPPKFLDQARELAAELRFLPEDSLTTDLLTLMEKEARGDTQYRPGSERAKRIDRAEELHRIEGAMTQFFTENEMDPAAIDKRLWKRTAQILQREGVSDPDVAFERAVMEDSERYERTRRARREVVDELPGWDVPDDAGATPAGGREAAPAGSSGERGGEQSGAEPGAGARAGGEPDRAAPGEGEVAAKPLGDAALATEAARILNDNPDLEIVLPTPEGGERRVRLADALKAVDEDAAATREILDCIKGGGA